MNAFLIDKHDLFGRQVSHSPHPLIPPNTTFDKLPDNICVCWECFFSDSTEASFIQQRSLSAGRDIIHTEDLPADQRPPRCGICGRFLNNCPPPQGSGPLSPSIQPGMQKAAT